MTGAQQAPAAADPAQAGTTPNQSQDGDRQPVDGGQQQQQTAQQDQQQQQTTAAGQATEASQAAASTAQQAPDGTRDPYELMGALLASPEGLAVFETTVQMLRGESPPAAGDTGPPASAPQGDAGDLQRRADTGDAEAKAELYDRQRADAARSTIVDEGRQAGRTEALQAFFRAPEVQALPQGDRVRVAQTYIKQGAEAALSQTIGILRGIPVEGADPAQAAQSAQQTSDGNQQTAQRQRTGGAPHVPGGAAEEAPAPQAGQTAEEALQTYFAHKDRQG